MKVIAIALAAAAVASAAPVGAQTVTRTASVRRADCTYVRSTNSVGDIIFGRTGTTVCDDHNRRVDNAWYQIGTDRNGNVIYERRLRDVNGKLVIQRARRNAAGNLVIVATRPYGQNKADYKAWKASEKAEDKAMKTSLSKNDYKTWQKTDKVSDKTEKANMKASDKAQKEAWKDTKVAKKTK
jgi:hypothetical protein